MIELRRKGHMIASDVGNAAGTLAMRDSEQAVGSLGGAAEAHAPAAAARSSAPADRLTIVAAQESRKPAPADARRPLVSIMIPTYEPQRFLIDAVRSVLAQDLGPELMQIAIVDDGSTQTRARSLLQGEVPMERLEFYEHSDNLGLAGNWNRAISLARGEFVHLLHQDDAVRPGFYTDLLAAMKTSERIGMAFCRHAFIDENDTVERISHRERRRPGVLRNWLERIGIAQRIQCPAALVRREAYEKLGGFRTDLRYALDWEMWVRIAAQYEVWYEPQVLAKYRRHASTESARLEAAGQTTADLIAAIEVLSTHFPGHARARLKQRAYRRLVRSHSRRALKLMRTGYPQLAAKQIESARTAAERLTGSLPNRWTRFRLGRAEFKLAAYGRKES
jgi:glycosyltransferase involved in cell wall biosynthesis